MMANMLWLTVSVVSLVALVNGNCPRAEPLLKTPDLQRIAGLWYKMASASPYEETKYECNMAQNMWISANNTLEFTTENYNIYNGTLVPDWNGHVWKTSDGNYENTVQNVDGRRSVYFEYYSDNYATYQIDYACSILNGVENPIPDIWIQSRFCEYNQTIFDTAVGILTKGGIPTTNLKWKKFGSPKCCAQGSSSASQLAN